MSSSYMPSSDAEFRVWVLNFKNYLSEHFEAVGLGEADVAELTVAAPAFVTALAVHLEAQNEARVACITKDTTRGVVEALVRGLVQRIQAYPGTTDADRRALGITVRGNSVNTPAIAPSDDKPLPLIDVSNRLKHVMRIKNHTGEGVKSAKPSNVFGCEVWRKVGAAPEGFADMELVGIATRSPYIIEYADGEGGKQAHYALRWVNTRGEKGSWSETESATIAA